MSIEPQIVLTSLPILWPVVAIFVVCCQKDVLLDVMYTESITRIFGRFKTSIRRIVRPRSDTVASCRDFLQCVSERLLLDVVHQSTITRIFGRFKTSIEPQLIRPRYHTGQLSRFCACCQKDVLLVM
ncbi:hypothetical protein AVEN_46815-1 [Araneus ventricosus]|uniref:Uncharacterized protein n=1 Tax=Araneus ventricosus TaxID=182803 RepID=A0A4Y2W6S5_ARAVE|nr:hypothetical protein AVEN_46815-1 [Araneus ventricosus]